MKTLVDKTLFLEKVEDKLLIKSISTYNPYLFKPSDDLSKYNTKMQKETEDSLEKHKSEIIDYLSQDNINEVHYICMGFISGVSIETYSKFIIDNKINLSYPNRYILHIDKSFESIAEEAFRKTFEIDYSETFILGGFRYHLDGGNAISAIEPIK